MLLRPCDSNSFLFSHYSNMDERFGSIQHIQDIIPKNDHIQRVDKLSRHISKMVKIMYIIFYAIPLFRCLYYFSKKLMVCIKHKLLIYESLFLFRNSTDIHVTTVVATIILSWRQMVVVAPIIIISSNLIANH